MIDEIRNITLEIVCFRNVNKHYTYFSFDACPFLLYADVFGTYFLILRFINEHLNRKEI